MKTLWRYRQNCFSIRQIYVLKREKDEVDECVEVIMEEVDEAKVEVEMETDFDRKYSIATSTGSIKENENLDDFQFDFIEDYDQGNDS